MIHEKNEHTELNLVSPIAGRKFIGIILNATFINLIIQSLFDMKTASIYFSPYKILIIHGDMTIPTTVIKNTIQKFKIAILTI